MIERRRRLWLSGSLAAVMAAGLAACGEGGESGEAGDRAASPVEGEAGEAAEAATVALASGEGGEAGEGAFGGGEAGVGAAYAAVPVDARDALRHHHLKGFLLIAAKELDAGRGPQAGALIGQGLLEVYDVDPAHFPNLDRADVQAASEAAFGDDADAGALLSHALAALDAAAAKADGDPADVITGLLRIEAGVYSEVVVDGYADPIEYQHAYGFLLSAKAVFDAEKAAFRAKDARRTAEAEAALDAALAAFPSVQAPETPTPAADVLAELSRAELALSGL